MAEVEKEIEDDYPGRLFLQASIYDNADLIQSLLEGPEKEHINAQDSYGRTALYTSVTNNSFECAHLLLQAEADPNLPCGSQCSCMTPLHIAARDNKHKFVSLLMDYGADTEIKDIGGFTALGLTEKHNCEECAIILHERIARKVRKKELLKQEFEEAVLSDRVIDAKALGEVIPEKELKEFINKIPDGQNSLLFRVCEKGYLDMVEFLLTRGAVVQVHPRTGYSPLHAACHTGHVQCAQAVLKHFPELIGAPTIEGAFPLHMACAEGQVGIVKLLLNFQYPDLVRKLYKESTGNRMYRLGLSVNSRDGQGRTPLHVAVLNNRIEVVKLLLKFRVEVVMKYTEFRMENKGESSIDTECNDPEGMQEPNITTLPRKTKNVEEIYPVEVDILDLDGNTPLHLAIKGNAKLGYHKVASLLLQCKANPNKPIVTSSGNTTPLMEACRMEDVDMMAFLLRYGARDDNLQVLRVAIYAKNWDMVGAIIQHRAHNDSEYKINVPALLQLYRESEGDDMYQDRWDSAMTSSKIFRSVWPQSAVVINWHSLELPLLEIDWFYKACWQLTGRPPNDVNPRLTLVAITRVDLSHNRLKFLPPEIFEMPSLRMLNASQNEIEDIHFDDNTLTPISELDDFESPMQRRNKPSDLKQPFKSTWSTSVLEEISLQHNRFRTVPSDLFKLPAVVKINLSHNTIECLPFEMWSSRKLQELNLSHNNLSVLPSSAYGSLGAIPIGDRSQTQDNLSIASSCGSPCVSEPGTPQRGLYLSSSLTSPAMLSSPCPPSSLGFQSSDSPYVYCPDELQTPTVPYQDLPIAYVNCWGDKIRVRTSLDLDSGNPGTDAPSKLSELNLSHNMFSTVPQGLSCLAPHLNKLNLSNNKLTQIGPIEYIPLNIKWLDFSYNNIISDVLFEGSAPGDLDLGSLGNLTVKTCFNPAIQAKQLKSARGTQGSRHTRMTRPNSGSSLSSSPGGSTSCPHRGHRQLEKLKSLKLSNNKLSKLVLTVTDGEEEMQSSGEDSQSSASSSSLGTRKERLSDAGIEESRELLYPGLSLLDVSYNCLMSLNPDIRLLTQLAELKVAGNKLKELPSEMGLLKKLWNLDFRGCPVEKSLQALLGEKAKKTCTILSYLKSVKEEATLYNRMKLMFVGIQGIGKTSLLNQLKKEGKVTSSQKKNWAQRMGHSVKDKDQKGENISTVGVDIGDLILHRNNRDFVFSTWDFGGQREYYATHQYFLSKRSLYLVMWNMTDGEQGLHEIEQWLVNIQARAPNSPVLIVGTHLDLITKRKYPPNYLGDLQRLLVEKYMTHTEPEKSGLPRVLGHIEISCKSSLIFNNRVRDLVTIICDVAFDEPLPGNKGARLLEQKVPASYVHLEEVVRILAQERKREGKDPVLHAEQYKPLVIQKMEEIYNTSFRDVAELSQATQFLHENGVLLHYDDISLQDIYFLDPQWLCDVLASVVTIREINSLAKSGIMRTNDLKILFKNSAFKPDDIRTYIINLLSKFEVALRWNGTNLLIPSLLPPEGALTLGFLGAEVRIPMLTPKTTNPTGSQRISQLPSNPASITQSADPKRSSHSNPQNGVSSTSDTSSSKKEQVSTNSSTESSAKACVSSHINPAVAIVRLYLMAYFPSGFWPRIITRLLGDVSMFNFAKNLYDFRTVAQSNRHFGKLYMEAFPEWRCWQTGVELIYLGVTLLRVREVTRNGPGNLCDYRQCSLLVKQDQDLKWNPLSVRNTSILEIIIPNQTVTITCQGGKSNYESSHEVRNDQLDKDSLNETTIQPSPQIVASLLSKLVNHVDTLLEDWYPDLGARFIQNARGMYLITRIVPCTRCLLRQIEIQTRGLSHPDSWSVVNIVSSGQPSGQTSSPNGQLTENAPSISPAKNKTDTNLSPVRPNEGFVSSGPQFLLSQLAGQSSAPPQTQDNCQAMSDKQRYNPGCYGDKVTGSSKAPPNTIYCYLAEQCLQAAQLNKIVFCIEHGNLGPYFIASASGFVKAAHVAPDSVFQDIGESYIVEGESITRGRFLGRGAFGAVYAGVMVDKETGNKVPVAMKMLQPVKPEGEHATDSLLHQYKVERNRWNKDPMKSACEAYLNARKELTILLTLKHCNIVPLLGLTLHPLSLVLSLAPLGALNEQLKEFVRAGARLSATTIAAVTKQVAGALHYLHSCQIIYRDLKSENVLVWSLPRPHHAHDQSPTRVKLADYGVSRSVLQSSTKGLAGTPPFIAPEIIQHNGEESYTEKVDIFSFGMFLYELLALKIPFEGEGSTAVGGANMKSHILSGGRPHLTDKDLCYPTHFLDLMTMSWSHDPGERPSANEIVSWSSLPEFSHLYNVVAVGEGLDVLAVCSAPNYQYMSPFLSPQDELLPFENGEEERSDVWLATKGQEGMDGALMAFTYHGHECIQAKRIELGPVVVSCMCITEDTLWAADTSAVIHVFRLLDCSEMLKFPATTRPNVSVKCLAFGSMERRVYIVLDNGRFILCEVDFPMDFSVNYSPVKTECPGNGHLIHCMGVLVTETRSSELWCGQSAGRISVWNLHNTQGSLRRLKHFPTDRPGHDVSCIAVCRGDVSAVWSYVYPGTHVYRWNSLSKTKDASLDLAAALASKPHSGRCTASTLCVHGNYLYIGTTTGYILVTDKIQMTTMCTLGGHTDTSSPLKYIVPLVKFEQSEDSGFTEGDSDSTMLDMGKHPTKLPEPGYIVALEEGYHSLLPSPRPADYTTFYIKCLLADCWK